MKHIFLILSCTALLATCKNYTKAVELINTNQLKEIITEKNLQLVDVRTPSEYKNGSIKNAMNIDIKDLSNFKREAAKLDTLKPIYVFCQRGGRSNRAAKVLNRLGFSKIYDYAGGYSEWSTFKP